MSVWEERLAGDIWLVRVSGRLDQSQANDLENSLLKLLLEGHNQLVIDLSEVTYINSSGLRCLVTIWRQARDHGGNVVLCNLTERITQVFAIVGFDKVFEIYPSRTEALDSLAGDQAT
jgi:anti-sigma B factor antagonist